MSTETLASENVLAKQASVVLRRMRSVTGNRNLQLAILILAISGAAVVANPGLLSSRVLANILIAAMVTAFVAMGQLLVLITKGIDLSVAPIMGLSAVIVGFQAQDHGLSLPVGLLLGAGVGVILGMGNGFLVSIVRMPPIIATLATFSVYGGLQFVVTGGDQVNAIPDEYTRWGVVTNSVLGVPPLFWAGIAAMGALTFVLRRTVFGRNLYAVGGDVDEAVRLGIPTRRVVFTAYVACGMLAGIAGVVYLMRTGSADSITGTQTNENLNAIAAALVGGASLTGGRGTAIGTVLGSIFLALTLVAMGGAAHIPPVWQPAGVGVLILVAVLADARARRGGEV